MAVVTARERQTLHVLAFLFFRMGQDARAERLYAALAALPPLAVGDSSDKNGNPASSVSHDADCDMQALLGLAAVALSRGQAEEALVHLRAILRQQTTPHAPWANTRKAAFMATAHLLRARALHLVGRLEESLAEVALYHDMTAEKNMALPKTKGTQA